jgi:FAD/FMN-containing dehydrogenase
MHMASLQSWGRYPGASQQVSSLSHRIDDCTGLPKDRRWLPYGNGRSYGDSCLNDGELLIHTRGMDRFLEFDTASGRIRCEGGVLLAEILDVALPRGWFLPVTPGTQYVTVGGAIANDVHGKNHHVQGTFGRHVLRFELLRSDGSARVCSADESGALFAATIGGLGLTGLIQWADIQLRPVVSALIDSETVKFESLAEFWALSADSDRSWEYTVAWIDCLNRGGGGTRGHFMRGNHAQDAGPLSTVRSWPRISVPLDPPFSLINPLSLRLFNTAYYHRQRSKRVQRRVHYGPFFYPLDGVGDWNRVYGRRGFLQFQCAVPMRHADAALKELLAAIAASGSGSFLAVLKQFGDLPSPGMLSFPRPGATLALDFPQLGAPTFELLDRLEAITLAAEGAIYPAKDARMSKAAFEASFPRLEEFTAHVDPQFSSSFWRRVHG